jgi:hypothetical protein
MVNVLSSIGLPPYSGESLSNTNNALVNCLGILYSQNKDFRSVKTGICRLLFLSCYVLSTIVKYEYDRQSQTPSNRGAESHSSMSDVEA